MRRFEFELGDLAFAIVACLISMAILLIFCFITLCIIRFLQRIWKNFKKCEATKQWLCLGRFTDGNNPRLLESEYSHFYIKFKNYCVCWHGVRTYYDFVIIPYTIIKCGCCERLYWIPHWDNPDRGGVGRVNEFNETQIKICECLKKAQSILHLQELLEKTFDENLIEFSTPQKTKDYNDPKATEFGRVIKIIGKEK